jgi:hypothetical protein
VPLCAVKRRYVITSSADDRRRLPAPQNSRMSERSMCSSYVSHLPLQKLPLLKNKFTDCYVYSDVLLPAKQSYNAEPARNYEGVLRCFVLELRTIATTPAAVTADAKDGCRHCHCFKPGDRGNPTRPRLRKPIHPTATPYAKGRNASPPDSTRPLPQPKGG